MNGSYNFPESFGDESIAAASTCMYEKLLKNQYSQIS